MLSLEQIEKLIKERIDNLEELNSKSRQFCKYLDLENKEDKEIESNEINTRYKRMYAVIQLEDLLNEIKETEVK